MENNIPLGRIARPDDITKVIAFLASERSKNITGQIIKVDGGRSLTSSGYVHYRGMKNMNSRFEPDGERAISWLGNLVKFGDKNVEIPKDEKELKKFINQTIKESNFSTNLEDAHKNNTKYKKVDINDQRLKEKFLQGKNPNPLYDIREKNQINYGKTAFGSMNNMAYNNSFQKNMPPIKQNLSYNINNQNFINQNIQKEEPMDNTRKYNINNNFNNINNQNYSDEE